jgi:hypothetical protein
MVMSEEKLHGGDLLAATGLELALQEAENELAPKYVRFVGAANALVPYEDVREFMKEKGVIPAGVIDTCRYREAFREIPSGKDGEKTIRCVVAKQKNGDYSVIY